ncbi:MAG: flagellar hook-associated 2 domain protein [Holophagaceae bacterium]|nr:flagellar hook-associated 2 domain protein [Holophagaceae bacterium]
MAVSFQGVTSGLQTDSLISAIMAQESLGVQRLQAKQTQNTSRSAALNTMRTQLDALTVSMSSLYDSFNKRTVSSTDADSTYVSATANKATNGSYEVKVSQVATSAKLSSTMSSGEPTNLAVADPNAAILTSSSGSFAVQGTDGVVKTFQLTNNSLNGLRDAINASGAGVSAAIVNTGQGTNPYQLVLTAKDTTTGNTATGTGSTGGKVTLAAIANQDATATSVVSSLGISSGTITGTFSDPTGLSGGLSSSGSNIAQDALFSINGIEMTRQSNTVKDAVDGVTFTLKKGDTSNATTLTVAQDKTSASTAMQDVITKYNAIITAYKDATTTTKSSDGVTITPGVLTNDVVARSVISQLRAVMAGSPEGLPSSATFKSTAQLGLKTNVDGTLSLDATVFQAAMDKDPVGVQNVFNFSGSSTSGSVSVAAGGSKTASGAVSFNVTYGTGGAVTGSLTVGSTTYSGLTGTNGTLSAPVGSLLEGLTLNVTASSSGTLNLSKGIGTQLQGLISSLTSYNGTIESTRTSLDEQNKTLTSRIESAQVLLDKRQAALKKQFDNMEATISQLRTVSGGLSSLG